MHILLNGSANGSNRRVSVQAVVSYCFLENGPLDFAVYSMSDDIFYVQSMLSI